MQQQPRLPLWFLVVNWALILTAFALGTYLGGRRADRLPEPQRSALEIVYQKVLSSHIEPQDEHELLERAISGMVDGLDRYSRYIPPRAVASYVERHSGSYEGIGAKIVTHGDDVVVHFPFPGGPAAAAGLLPGDRLLAVGDTELADAETRARVVELVRGPANTEVRLRIGRDDTELTVAVPRGSVQRPCIKWAGFADEQAGLGYVYLTDFHPTAAAQLFHAIESLQQQHALNGLILDLRMDGGGSLDQCLSIGRAFIRNGILATQVRRGGEEHEVYRANPAECRWPDLPLVLLVDQNSASASEVLSGALQDHGRAVVVGMRTHGKGYVNTVYTWQNHEFKLKLTTGSYRTPNGRNIERNQTTNVTKADKKNGGILPSVEVELPAAQQATVVATLRRAIEVPEVYRDRYEQVATRYGFDVEHGPTVETDAQFAAALAELHKLVEGH